MSYDLVGAALWLPLEPARKLVLVAMCERANLKTGECWPGLAEIAVRSSLSRRRAGPHIAALEAMGYLRSGPHPRQPGRTTKRFLNVSRIINEGRAAQDLLRQGWDDSSLTDEEEEGALWQEEGTNRPEEGTLRPRGGDAVTLVTVIEPSEEPSMNRQGSPPIDDRFIATLHEEFDNDLGPASVSLQIDKAMNHPKYGKPPSKGGWVDKRKALRNWLQQQVIWNKERTNGKAKQSASASQYSFEARHGPG